MTGFELLAALAWPIVVVVLVIFVVTLVGREGLRELTRRLRKATGPWGSFDLDSATDNLENAVQQGSILVGSERVDPTPTDGEVEPAGPAELEDDRLAGLARRQSLEEIIIRAAEWGAVRARAGETVEGITVNWHGGVPSFSAPTRSGLPMGTHPGRAIAHLKQEIAYLERERESGEPNRANRAHGQLLEARAKLAGLEGTDRL